MSGVAVRASTASTMAEPGRGAPMSLQCVQGFGRAQHRASDRSSLAVAYPTANAQPTGLFHHGPAETDTLDTAADHEPQAALIHGQSDGACRAA